MGRTCESDGEGMTPTFEAWLVEQLQPIRGFALASALYHLFDLGIAQSLIETSPWTISGLAERHDLDEARLKGFLAFLQVEDFLKIEEAVVRPLPRLLEMEKAWPWYEMLIGGYAQTYLDIGKGLRAGSAPLVRDAKRVGSGSCKISSYDAIPLTKTLLAGMAKNPTKVIDIGCGNALYLKELSSLYPGLSVVGVEPDGDDREQSLNKNAARELGSQIKIYPVTGQDFIKNNFERDADVVIVAFVLQEILGQDGRQGVLDFLAGAIRSFPDSYIVVIEVKNAGYDRNSMEHGLAKGYYNPYFLVHHFTRQSLESEEFWLELFRDAGLKIERRETTDEVVDSTGFEVGFLLSRA